MASSNSVNHHEMAEEFTKKLLKRGEELTKKLVEKRNTEENLNLSDTEKKILQVVIKKLYLEESIKYLEKIADTIEEW